MYWNSIQIAAAVSNAARILRRWRLIKLPPRYVSTRKGDVFVRVNEMSTECEVTVIQAIAKAIEIVSKNPHHTTKS